MSESTDAGGCFQYVKGTKKKANHNFRVWKVKVTFVVSNTSKVLKRKQITTDTSIFLGSFSLFPIRQRY